MGLDRYSEKGEIGFRFLQQLPILLLYSLLRLQLLLSAVVEAAAWHQAPGWRLSTEHMV